MAKEIKDDDHLITLKTEELLNDALDEARDEIFKRGGQEIDWVYHKDTNQWKITVSWMIVDKDD